MSYAIIRTGGKQFRVEPGAVIRVPTIAKEVDETIEVETLLIANGDSVDFSANLAALTATVVSHGRGEKIIVFKKKRRKQYKRKQGHRQGFTAIKFETIG